MYRRKFMKRKKIFLGFTTLLTVSLLVSGCGKEIEVKNGSKVAVSTSKDKFTATEYYNEIKESNISILIDMLDKNLLSEKFKTDDTETEEIEKQMEQIKTYYGSDENTYKSVLKSYFGVESEKELKEKLSLEYKRNLAVKDYISNNIKDDEIKKYYKENIYGEVKASHILISLDVDSSATDEEKANAEEEAKETAEKVIKELKDGKTFESLAKKYSKDSATATNGGDLGYFKLDEMVEEFSNAVKELKVDEYTKEPVKTEYGYHIILKTGEKDKPALKEVKDEIKEKLTTEKLNNDTTLYYEALMGFREDNKLSWNDDKLEKAYKNYMNDLINTAKENS